MQTSQNSKVDRDLRRPTSRQAGRCTNKSECACRPIRKAQKGGPSPLGASTRLFFPPQMPPTSLLSDLPVSITAHCAVPVLPAAVAITTWSPITIPKLNYGIATEVR